MGIQDEHGQDDGTRIYFSGGSPPISDAEADQAYRASLASPGPFEKDPNGLQPSTGAIPTIHNILDARAHLASDTPDIATAQTKIGNVPPSVSDVVTLHTAQHWHLVRAEICMLRGHYVETIRSCEAAIELGVTHGEEDPDQRLYLATLYCLHAEASRRSGTITPEILDGLAELAQLARQNEEDPNHVALAQYAEQTIERATSPAPAPRRRILGLFAKETAAKATPVLATLVHLPH